MKYIILVALMLPFSITLTAQKPVIVPLPHLLDLPKLSAGTMQNVQENKTDWQDGGEILRRFQDASLVQLRGIPGIREGAKGLPQVATDLLVLHARTLPAEVFDSYIVNPKLVEEWLKNHPLPPEFVAKVRRAAADDGKKKKKGCSTKHLSTGCVQNEVEQSIDDLTRAWQKAWDDTVAELGLLLGKVDDIMACFQERTLTLSDIPVSFSVEPQIPLNFEAAGKSGNVKGGVAVGVPVNADFKATVKMFYIPCLPFAVRPKSIAANGTMTVGGSFTANVNATGQFNRLFSVPPKGGIQIPIAVLPIALGGVPIAVLDISVYLDGTLEVTGKGTLDGSLKLQSTQTRTFAFECSGHGCEYTQYSASKPENAVESSVKLDGRIQMKPAIYAALQLSLNYNLLSARAGPQPFMLGEIYGCAAASASQNSSGASSKEQSYALAADLDWGVELRAEAMAGGKKVVKKIWKLDQGHIYFKDLAQSTGLKPIVAGTLQPSVGQSAAYTVTMPACYPYPDPIEYQIKWTGGASASTGTPNSQATKGLPGKIPGRTTSNSAPSRCTLQPGQANCSGGPMSITSLNLTWPAPGDYILTVTPVGDKHGRKFDLSRATQVNIQVGVTNAKAAEATPLQKDVKVFNLKDSAGNASPTEVRGAAEDKSGSDKTDKWEIKRNPDLKGAMGRITIRVPEKSVYSLTVFKAGTDEKSAYRYIGTEFLLLPGKYDTRWWDNSNWRLSDIPVRRGMDTRIRAGMLNLNLSGTSWVIYDETKTILIEQGYSVWRVGLPIGKYYVKVNNDFAEVVIKDGEVTEF